MSKKLTSAKKLLKCNAFERLKSFEERYFPDPTLQEIEDMCMVPSGGGKTKKPSSSSLKYSGAWQETKSGLKKKAGMDDVSASESDSSTDEEAAPRKSTVPKHITLPGGLEVVTSDISLQERAERATEKDSSRKSTFGNMVRKTKIWFQEAVTGDPVFSDEDWEEDLAREAALARIKKKKVKQFRQSLIRKSAAFGPDFAADTEAWVDAFKAKPLELTDKDLAQVERETQEWLEESQAERDQEEMVRRETKAAEKAQKIPNRFSLALKALVSPAKTTEQLAKHPRFSSMPAQPNSPIPKSLQAQYNPSHRSEENFDNPGSSKASRTRTTSHTDSATANGLPDSRVNFQTDSKVRGSKVRISDTAIIIDQSRDHKKFRKSVFPGHDADIDDEQIEDLRSLSQIEAERVNSMRSETRETDQELHPKFDRKYVVNDENNPVHKSYRKSCYVPNQKRSDEDEDDSSEEGSSEESSGDEYESEESTTVSTLEPEQIDVLSIENEIPLASDSECSAPRKPQVPTPPDHTPRPEAAFVKPSRTSSEMSVGSVKKVARVSSHAQCISRNRRNKRNVSVVDLGLQCALDESLTLITGADVKSAGTQFPSLRDLHPQESQTTGPWTSHQYPQHLKNGFTSDEESLESFETDSCFNSLVLPPMDTSGLKTPPEFNVDSEHWSQWADAEFNERFEATFLASPSQYLDQAVGRQNIAAGIHTSKKPTGSASGVHLPDLCLLSKDTQKLAGVIQAVGAFKRGAVTGRSRDTEHERSLERALPASDRKIESSTTVDLLNAVPELNYPSEFDTESELDIELCFDDIAMSVTAASLSKQQSGDKNVEPEEPIETGRLLKDDCNRLDDFTENTVSDVSLLR